MSDDILAFVHAYLDEDERIARAVEDGSAPWDGQWVADGPDALLTYNGHVLAYGHRTTDGRNLPIPLKPGLADHWARQDPAAVLRRIAADRKLIAEHAQYSLPDGSEIDECRVCGGSNEAWPCPTLRIIAEGYGWTETA